VAKRAQRNMVCPSTVTMSDGSVLYLLTGVLRYTRCASTLKWPTLSRHRPHKAAQFWVAHPGAVVMLWLALAPSRCGWGHRGGCQYCRPHSRHRRSWNLLFFLSS
jgi:hypothetical protein